MKKLTINLPQGFVEAVNRRHNGRFVDEETRINGIVEMQLLYNNYKKNKVKLDYCEGDWWDEQKIESHFMKPKWYYAHRKRKLLMKKTKELHSKMFYLLVTTDGNYETFDPYWCISAEEIFEDFNRKYNR